MAHGLSCSAACGIFPEQGSNPGPLHWQTDSFFFFLNKFIYLIYLFLAALGLCCGAWASHCSGFSCCGAQALGVWASVVVAHGL